MKTLGRTCCDGLRRTAPQTAVPSAFLLAAFGWAQPLAWAQSVDHRPASSSLRPSEHALEAPKATVSLDASEPRKDWILRVRNDGTTPLRFHPDERAISFDVTPRSAAKSIRCALPADVEVDHSVDRMVTLDPGGQWAKAIEPRLYCFAGSALGALAQGSIVVARVGASRPEAEAVSSSSVSDGQVVDGIGSRFLVSAPIALPDEIIPPMGEAPVDRSDWSLFVARPVDAAFPNAIEVPLVLRNEGTRPWLVRFSPEVLSFDVVGPSGSEACSWPTLPGASTRELFTSVAPGRKVELNVLLSAYCSDRIFQKEGLFTIRPRLDTRTASGKTIGLPSFDGQVAAKSVGYVRLRQGRMSDSP